MSSLWFWVLGWLLSGTAVIGNGFVIFLISTRRRLHTAANWFILSLAVADFCVGFTLIPFTFNCEVLAPWERARCQVLKHFRWFFVYASVSSLCAMAADRYIAIVKPLRYTAFMQRSRLLLLLAISWSVPTVLRLICFSVVFSLKKEAALNYFLPVILILFEFLPCAVLLVVTIHMVLIARKISRQTAALRTQVRFNHGGTAPNPKASCASETSTVRVIGFVVAFFVLCYAASLFASFCDIFRKHCSTPPFVSLLRRLCLVTNSAANPIAYAFLKKDIRTELRKVLFCKDNFVRSGGDEQQTGSTRNS